MPERASYSLFPPPEDVLRKQENRRMSRARASSNGTLRASAKRSASAHSSVGDSSSLFEENKSSTELERTSTCKSTDNLPLKNKDARRDSTLRKLSSSTPYRPKITTDLPTIYSPPPDQTEHTPISPADAVSSIGPPPTKSLPSIPRPTPTVDTTALKPPTKSPVQISGSCHIRNLTNSTVTSVTKPSPVTPVSQTSGPSLFSPITPPSAGPSPVKYPTVPRLSSSPASSVVEAWSPPRRSHSRSTNHSQTTTADLISSYAHTRDGTYGRRTATTQLQRAPSNAASARTRPSNHATPRPSVSNERPRAPSTSKSVTSPAAAPIHSILPAYNPELPLNKQGPQLVQGSTPQFHLPAQRIEAKPYQNRTATPSLTREALEAHNASSESTPRPHQPSESRSQPPTPEPSKPTSSYPPRSQSLPQKQKEPQTFLDTSSMISGRGSRPPAQVPPEFPPPPRPELPIKSKTRALLTKPRPPPKDNLKAKSTPSTTAVNTSHPSDAMVRKGDGTVDKKQKTLDFQLSNGAYRAATSATTRYDKDLDTVTTTATTTIVNVPNKNGPLHASTKKDSEKTQDGYRNVIEGREFSKEEAELQHQHSVAVALGAVAFVMGAGVELVGGAVNGVKGGMKMKGKGRKGAAVEA